jgi:hypothetical protein
MAEEFVIELDEAAGFVQKVKVIDIKPFPYELRLIVTNNIKEAEVRYRRSRKDHSEPVADGNTGAITLTSHDLRSIVIIMPFKCDIGYIAHEVCHAVNRLFQFVGAKYESEIWAYYHGWFVREAAVFVYDVSGKFDKDDTSQSKAVRTVRKKKPLTRTKRK